MAKLTIVHKNTDQQEIDIGNNDKISWVVLHDNTGRTIIFTPRMIECLKCGGGGGLCSHENGYLFAEECPEAIDDCENCDFAVKCPNCKGEGVVAETHEPIKDTKL